MIGILSKFTLNTVPDSDCTVDACKAVFSLINNAYFKRLPQRSRSSRRWESDLFGHWAFKEWLFYEPYARQAITDRKYKALRDSPRPSRPVNYPTEFNNEIPLRDWSRMMISFDFWFIDHIYWCRINVHWSWELRFTGKCGNFILNIGWHLSVMEKHRPFISKLLGPPRTKNCNCNSSHILLLLPK